MTHVYKLLFVSLRRAQLGLSGGEAGNGDAEGRATDVVKSDFVAELEAVGVAAVLTADADLQLRVGGAAIFNDHTHQLADAFTVERMERVDGQNLDFAINA